MLLSDIKEIKDGRIITKDTAINITINQGAAPEVIIKQEEPEIVEPKEDIIYSDDIEYKGYVMKQIPATGEIDIFATGGALIQHAENYDLAKAYIDNLGL